MVEIMLERIRVFTGPRHLMLQGKGRGVSKSGGVGSIFNSFLKPETLWPRHVENSILSHPLVNQGQIKSPGAL